jgi:hypothetical protein
VSLRGLIVLLVVASALLHALVVMPAREETAGRGQEYKKLRETLRQARAELEALEAKASARARAKAILARSAPGAPSSADVLADLRAELVDSLDGLALRNVSVHVTPRASTDGAAFTLSVTGAFRAVVGLTGDLTRPEAGP